VAKGRHITKPRRLGATPSRPKSSPVCRPSRHPSTEMLKQAQVCPPPGPARSGRSGRQRRHHQNRQRPVFTRPAHYVRSTSPANGLQNRRRKKRQQASSSMSGGVQDSCPIPEPAHVTTRSSPSFHRPARHTEFGQIQHVVRGEQTSGRRQRQRHRRQAGM
jgi:hypothetical protein